MVMQGVFFLFYRTGCFLTGSQKLVTVCCGSNSLVLFGLLWLIKIKKYEIWSPPGSVVPLAMFQIF